jgi:2-amino-4-hydroxy-6-hydroxymethyldihydropteridine diphosphokinase
MSVIAYLGLGSNLGHREENIARALELLGRRVGIERISSIYETEPVGYREQPWFLNAVCRVSTMLEPFDLLRLVKEVEGELGRIPSFTNGPRIIDIDILLYGDEVLQANDLTIPHPRLAERPFVLVPLAEIAPELVHPVVKRTIEQLLQEVQSSHHVRRWGDVSGLSSATF